VCADGWNWSDTSTGTFHFCCRYKSFMSIYKKKINVKSVLEDIILNCCLTGSGKVVAMDIWTLVSGVSYAGLLNQGFNLEVCASFSVCPPSSGTQSYRHRFFHLIFFNKIVRLMRMDTQTVVATLHWHLALINRWLWSVKHKDDSRRECNGLNSE